MSAVATHISNHYLCAWGELSSSGRAFHPGERPTGKQIRRRQVHNGHCPASLRFGPCGPLRSHCLPACLGFGPRSLQASSGGAPEIAPLGIPAPVRIAAASVSRTKDGALGFEGGEVNTVGVGVPMLS